MSDEGLTERLLQQDRFIMLAAIAVIFSIACVYTIFGVGMKMSALQMTMMAGDPPMKMAASIAMPANWTAEYAVLVFLMWWIMMIAMMLPSASPTVLLYTALLRRREQESAPAFVATIFLAGYLVVWAGFSAVAVSLQWLLELRGLVSPEMMTLTSSILAGVVLLVAGIYQFSSIKDVCLDHCRSPMQFLVTRRRPGNIGAFLMGLEHGAFCLGCCWFLMALLFVGGIMNLYWIAGLAILVALEKFAPMGGRIARIAGAVLIICGLWLLSQTAMSFA
ncbi:MAG: DUF2182 domain-containing protein [Hyphomicrobiaceae bacterium TMED74]|nr:hypothetical protein [Filomicrobium sp.]RPG45633.1 MAG: DUF2182 domain-containing protein [Hyphomicrobiaceae bacterium TMED74]